MPETFREKAGIPLSLAWLFFLGFVTRVIFGPMMPKIERDLGFSHVESGTMFLLLSIGYMLAPVCAGLISSRINHRGTLKLSAWLVGLALIPFYFVGNRLGLGILLLIIGFSGSLHLPSAIATITAEIQKSDWGKGLGVHQCAPPIGFILAPLIVTILSQWFYWRQILLCWGILALVSALGYTVFGRGGDFPGKVVSPANIKKVGSLPSFWLLVLLFAMAMAGNAGIFSMLPLFFVNERGFGLDFANTLIGLSQISGFLVVFLAGMISDRVGQKRVMGFSLLFAGLLTIIISLAKGWLLMGALFLQPAVLTAFFPAAFAALARLAHPSMRSVTSAMGPPLAFLLGGGLIPVMIGRVAESYSFADGILFAGCFMLTGPLLVGFLRLGEFDEQAGC